MVQWSVAQSQNTIKRDLEICRITLENYLVQWDMAVMLNTIKESKANYSKANGATITILAPNASILITSQRGNLHKGDEEIMNTFYSTEMISLQRKHLKTVTMDFLEDFSSYLPKIGNEELIRIEYIVTDADVVDKFKDSSILPSEVFQEARNYKITYSWSMKDIADLASKSISKEQFGERIQTEIE